MKKALATVVVMVVFGQAAASQEEDPETRGDQDRIETFGNHFSAEWGYQGTAATRALNPDGTVSESLPPSSRRHVERKMAAFEHQFGSAAEHGLEHGTVVPREFCPLESRPSWGFGLADHLGSVLLSEVAVEATVSGTTIGLSPGGSPNVLLELTDLGPLTRRSPTPQYAIVSVGQMAIGDHVFCGERGPIATGDPMGRSWFARRWYDLVDDGCRPTSVRTDEDGKTLPVCETDE